MSTPMDQEPFIISQPPLNPSNRNPLSNLRIATLIWFSLNTILALILILRIYYHGRREEKEEFRLRYEEATAQGKVVTEAELRGKRNWKTALRVSTDEVFPLFLAIGLAVQGIVFTRFVARTLDGLPPKEGACRGDSEVIWTALWIPIYITFVFQIEALIRSLSTPRLQPRGRYTLHICTLSIFGLLFVSWLPTHLMKVPKNALCNGQIMQYLNHFSSGGMGLLGLLVPLCVVMALIILMHLSRSVPITEIERRSAKKIVYFSLVGAFQWCLVMPFFATSNASRINHALAFLATVILGMSSIFANSLYFYLRSKLKHIPSPSLPPKDEEATRPRRFQQVTDRLPVEASPPMSERRETMSSNQQQISEQILTILSPPIKSPASQLNSALSGSTFRMSNQPTPLYNPKIQSPMAARAMTPSFAGPSQMQEVARTYRPHPLRQNRMYSAALANKPPAPRPASAQGSYNQHSRNSSTSSSTGLLSTIEGSLPITYDGGSRAVSTDERLLESRRWTGRRYSRGVPYY